MTDVLPKPAIMLALMCPIGTLPEHLLESLPSLIRSAAATDGLVSINPDTGWLAVTPPDWQLFDAASETAKALLNGTDGATPEGLAQLAAWGLTDGDKLNEFALKCAHLIRPELEVVETPVPTPTVPTAVKTEDVKSTTVVPVKNDSFTPGNTSKSTTVDLTAIAAELATVAEDTAMTKTMVNRLGEIIVTAQQNGGRVRIVPSRETTVEDVARRVCVLLHVHGRMTKSEIRNSRLSSGQRAKLDAAIELAVTSGAIRRELSNRLSLVNPEPLGVFWDQLDDEKSRLDAKAKRRVHVPIDH